MKSFFSSVVLMCFFAFCQSAIAENTFQTNSLFFIGGTPTRDVRPLDATILYQMDSDNGKIKRLRAINSRSQMTEFIHPYYEQGVLVTGSIVEPGYYQLDIVNTNDPNLEHSIEVETCDSCVLMASDFHEDSSGLNYIHNFGVMNNSVLEFSLISSNLQTGEQVEVGWDVYKNVVSNGRVRVDVDSGGELRTIFSDEGSAVFRHDKRVPLNWKLPIDLELKKGETIIQSVNNRNYRVITTNQSYEGLDKPIQRTIYRVFDKTKKMWSLLKLDGVFLKVRVFGDWLVSEKTFVGFKKTSELKIYNEKISEGFKNYKEVFDRKGDYIKYLKKFDIDQPGVLMLKNLKSGQYYEIDADNSDSEILLIDNNEIIYRDADEIKTAFIKNDQIEKGAILAKGDEVMSVHWAFKKR